MTNLYISLYDEPNPERFAELMICLNINIKNKNIDRIIIFAETSLALDFEKVQVIKLQNRVKFNNIFMFVNIISGADDINIIANSDIYFTDFPKLPEHHECFALTRYDILQGISTFFNRRDSQDVWIMRGPIKQIDAPFFLGQGGCDNSLAFLLRQAGYNVSNPSLTIRTYHLHETQKRNWHLQPLIPEPYLLLDPHI